MPDLAAGAYTVQFSDGCGNTGNYAPLTYPKPVDVKAGATTRHIDGALTPGGTITGTVTAAAGGAPQAGICVTAVDRLTGNPVAGAVTATDGTYAMDGLATGSYTVDFSDECGNTGNYAPFTYPKPVHVKAGQTTSNINAALSPGPSVAV
jgi:hypothetical protein